MSAEWQVTDEKLYPKGNNPMDNDFYGYTETGLELPDGRPARYFGVDVGPCVHVVAIGDKGETFLVRQRRPNARAVGSLVMPETVEFPGGFASEDLEASARAELRQEVRLVAEEMKPIGSVRPSSGISNEVDTVFLARGLSRVPGPRIVEATEQDMRRITGDFDELYEQIITGTEPASAQTIAAFALAARHR